MITAIADTSFVLATQNKRDRFHALCRQVYSRQDEIVLPQSTLNEIIYLNTKYRGAFSTIQFLQRLPSLKFKLTALTYDDLARTTALLQRYCL